MPVCTTSPRDMAVGEAGDEFNQKPNTLYLDGEKVISFVPWRDDCGTYRNWNPCSGNFSNGLSSSDLSRSNWCPGTVTNPEYIYLGDLEAGEHSITVKYHRVLLKGKVIVIGVSRVHLFINVNSFVLR